MKVISRISLGLLSVFLCIGFCHTAIAEETTREPLRERIKEALQERVSEKAAGRTIARTTSYSDVNEYITRSGDYMFSIEQGGYDRKYLVHVPPSYDSRVPTPLVMAFHGGGGSMNHMANDELYGLIRKSNKEGFIIVFPNGYSKFSKGILATWNAGNCCGDARDKNIDDVGFVKTIISNLTRQMNIDPNRIFATGMSNGGMMTYVVACELPDIFKAIAAVAGTDNTVTCPHKQPISVIHFHAKDDTHVLFNGGAGEDAFRDLSKVTNFTSVPDSINRWVGYNQCQPNPQRVLTLEGAYCDLYSGCKDGKQVELCVTDTGGHSWPGGNKRQLVGVPKVIYANDIMWDFFKNQK